jgi:hypothetical protein
VGKIFFMLVRIKVKHMELAIIRKETVGYDRNGNHPLSFWGLLRHFLQNIAKCVWEDVSLLFRDLISLRCSIIRVRSLNWVEMLPCAAPGMRCGCSCSHAVYSTRRTRPKAVTESETITKFEIMDGAPVKGRWRTVAILLFFFCFFFRGVSANRMAPFGLVRGFALAQKSRFLWSC